MVVKQGIFLLWMIMMMSSELQACEVTVQHAWLRLPPPVSDTAAAYMQLNNHCQTTKQLKSISSPQASMVMMHHVKMKMMQSLVLKPQDGFTFQPKANHVMLMGLKAPIHKDTKVTLILHWQDGHQQTLQLEVKDMRGESMQGMNM
ncbi:MAG: copper chaperone PCu(A)C [Mariprofundaceae bacterium]|nr:copper chaperone PCu(A)C [Mariprofundaceae bacterium]